MRFVLAVVLVAAAVSPCSASAITLTGHASTYGSDPITGIEDRSDNDRPALAGASNSRPGIAVMRYDTLGRWWRVCAPAAVAGSPNARARCRWVRQTDIGPAGWTGRVIDINSTAARILWRLPQGNRFPTDQGRWRLRSHGPNLTRRQLRQARYERCNSSRCRTRLTPHR